MPKRRVLEKIKLTEISGVDRPCQEGAKVVIMKRETAQPQLDSLDARLKRLQLSMRVAKASALARGIGKEFDEEKHPREERGRWARAGRAAGRAGRAVGRGAGKVAWRGAKFGAKVGAKVAGDIALRALLRKYDPDQPRDKGGRWSRIGGAVWRGAKVGAKIASGLAAAAIVAGMVSEFDRRRKEAGGKDVDRLFRRHVPPKSALPAEVHTAVSRAGARSRVGALIGASPEQMLDLERRVRTANKPNVQAVVERAVARSEEMRRREEELGPR